LPVDLRIDSLAVVTQKTFAGCGASSDADAAQPVECHAIGGS
jgi:hypothetical protein